MTVPRGRPAPDRRPTPPAPTPATARAASPTAPIAPTAPTEALPTGARPGPREVLAGLRRELPLLVVLAIAAYAFWRIGLQHWREGTTELGLALVVGAGLRAFLADATAGLLAVRARRVDVVTYAGGGLVVVLVSLTITGGMLAGR